MDKQHRICVFMFFGIIAFAYGETVDSKWRAQIEEKMDEMLQTIQNNKNLIENQSEVCEKQTNAIQRQAVEVENLRQRVKALEGQSDKFEQHNGRLSNVSSENRTVLSSIERRQLYNKGSKNRFIRRVLSPRSNTPAAFYAYISRNFGEVGANHIFLYDIVVTNQGNAYNKHTGAFTAPSNGLYAFCYTAFAAGEHIAGETGDYGEVTVKLIHNGAYKGSIHVDTEVNWDDEMSTGFAILMLEAGDVVLTKSKDRSQGSFRSGDWGRWSFSGFQIA